MKKISFLIKHKKPLQTLLLRVKTFRLNFNFKISFRASVFKIKFSFLSFKEVFFTVL